MQRVVRDLVDPDISLDENNHVYIHARYPALTFTSCTQFVGSFFEPFNSQLTAEKLTSSHPKYKGQSPQELVEQWQSLAAFGSLVHAEIDQYLKNETNPGEEMSRIGVDWLKQNNWEGATLFSEVILYSTELKLAGTVDLVARNSRTGRVTLYDWKTSQRIDKTPFQGKRGIRGAALLLPDCNYVHYSLQLSLYAYLLEKYYGVDVDAIYILHLDKNLKQVEKIEGCRYTSELGEMLKAGYN